jgi:hypothetical protein
MAKPSKAYLELMEKFRQNEEAERQVQLEEALEQQKEKKVENDNHNAAMQVQNKEQKKQQVAKEYSQFITGFKSEILESVLAAIVQKALPTVINEGPTIHGVLNEFIEEEGVYKILNNMRSRTQLLAELAEDIDDAYDKGTETVDPTEPETFSADKSAETDLISKVEDDDTIDDVADVIKAKVSRATEEFVEKNVMDQTEIKDTLLDAKNRMAQVRTGDDALDEEIRQEQTLQAKRKVNDIRNRPHTVFEQLVINISEAVLKEEGLKEQFVNESGSFDMEKVVNKATGIYAVMETLNTLKIKDFDTDDIQHMIEFE